MIRMDDVLLAESLPIPDPQKKQPLRHPRPSWVNSWAPGGPKGGVFPNVGGSPPPSSLQGSSGPHFVTSVRHWNRHRFWEIFWEHSASALDRPRCSGPGILQGQLDVDHFAPEAFQERSKTTFGVPIGSSRSPLSYHGEAQITMPKWMATGGAKKAKVTGRRGYSLPLLRAPGPGPHNYI